MPAGNVRTGSLLRIVSSDSIASDFHDLLDVPIRTGAGPAVYLRDVGAVADSTDIPTGYALVNGRRAVYVPVTKRPDASTLTVVSEVKQNLARFRTLVPSDIDISYQFDQSAYVKSALMSVVREGLLGALLTGLIVLLFLADWRSSFIVITTIPFALLTSLVGLWVCGQTINIMTLGGLALAVGILVDEGVVEIENIDATLLQESNLPVARGVLNATRRTVVPRFLSMLSIVAVFVPSLFMTGVAKNLFVPFSLAVAFAMVVFLPAVQFIAAGAVSVAALRTRSGHSGAASRLVEIRACPGALEPRPSAPGAAPCVGSGDLRGRDAGVAGTVGPKSRPRAFPQCYGASIPPPFRCTHRHACGRDGTPCHECARRNPSRCRDRQRLH